MRTQNGSVLITAVSNIEMKYLFNLLVIKIKSQFQFNFEFNFPLSYSENDYKAVPCLRQSSAGFNLKPGSVGFKVYAVTVIQFILLVFRFSPVRFIPLMLYTHIDLHSTVNRRTKRRDVCELSNKALQF